MTENTLPPTTPPSAANARTFLASGKTPLVFPTPEELSSIALARGGDLRTVPFAALLLGLELEQRSCILEVRRGDLRKRIMIENGVPVACRSNVLHNTFSFYLRETGVLSQDDYSQYTEESLQRRVPIGEVLLERGLMTSEEILSHLQKLLAKVLLDVFAWSRGTFLIIDQAPEVQAPLAIRVPQLVLTGTTRFTPQAQLERAVRELGVQPIAAYAEGTTRFGSNPLDGLRLAEAERAIVETLRQGAMSIDELPMLLGLERATVRRCVVALSMIGVIDLADRVAARHGDSANAKQPSTMAPTTSDFTREQLVHFYLDHRRMSHFELCGLDSTASSDEISAAFIDRACALANWAASREPKLAEQARDLLFAMTEAYSELSDEVKLEELRRTAPPPIDDEVPVLVDPQGHYDRGLALMKAGKHAAALPHFEVAADCVPQNGLYRSQAALCLFRSEPDRASEALSQLRETHRLDPSCGLAFLYAGRLLVELGDLEGATRAFERAIQTMPADPRPIEGIEEIERLEGIRAGQGTKLEALPEGSPGLAS